MSNVILDGLNPCGLELTFKISTKQAHRPAYGMLGHSPLRITEQHRSLKTLKFTGAFRLL